MVVMPGHYGVLTSAVKNADKHFCIVLIGLINKGIEYEIKSCTESILYCYIRAQSYPQPCQYQLLIVIRLDLIKPILILSDMVFYQIGGGVGYMAPPSRGTIPAAEFGIGWKANLMCGNFDIKTSIKNQLNGLTEGFKDLYVTLSNQPQELWRVYLQWLFNEQILSYTIFLRMVYIKVN